MPKTETSQETKRITNEIEALLNKNGLKVPLDVWDKFYKFVDYLRIKE